MAMIVMFFTNVEINTGGFASVAWTNAFNGDEVSEVPGEIGLQEFAAPFIGLERCDKKAIEREVDPVGSGS